MNITIKNIENFQGVSLNLVQRTLINILEKQETGKLSEIESWLVSYEKDAIDKDGIVSKQVATHACHLTPSGNVIIKDFSQ